MTRVMLGLGFLYLLLDPPVLANSGQSPEESFGIFQDCELCPEMVVIPQGRSSIGRQPNQQAPTFERKSSEYTLDYGFAVGRFELLFKEYNACVEDQVCSELVQERKWTLPVMPATYMKWSDAKTYVAWLGKRTRKPYRLLTADEWEFVAKGGVETVYPWGNSFEPDMVVCRECNSKKGLDSGAVRIDADVLSFSIDRSSYINPQWGEKVVPPNPYGIFYMLGNVPEWAENCMPSQRGEPQPLTGAGGKNCTHRTIKGRAFDTHQKHVRTSSQAFFDASKTPYIPIGTRVALSLDRGNTANVAN
jgi:formylglycine-generating enzyme required for sulfatase activity